MRRGAPFDTCFALSASTCIVTSLGLCIDTIGLVCLRIRCKVWLCKPSKSCQVVLEKRLLINITAAMGLILEKALRGGNVLPGNDFDPRKHLSRFTIRHLLRPMAELRKQLAALVNPMQEKSTHQ